MLNGKIELEEDSGTFKNVLLHEIKIVVGMKMVKVRK